MEPVPFALPPGIYRNGTPQQSGGRWYDGDLVRFYEGAVQPIGGWRQRSQTAVPGRASALLQWRLNNNSIRAAIGTSEGLFLMTQGGAMSDITPDGLVAQRSDATFGSGYGAGMYGVGAYGLPIISETTILDASVWSLGAWGENLVGCVDPDEVIYEWQPGAVRAVPIPNAPSARSILVTEERILMALGADGDPRRVSWSDQENNTEWAPAITNQAGGRVLSTVGQIQTGVTVNGGGLVFTELDCHRFRYIDADQVYVFDRAGDGSGVVSPKAVQPFDGKAAWMGPEGFWLFAGYVQPIPCDVADEVFTNINRAQISKVWSLHNAAFGEVWWFYPDRNALDCNSYVAWSYRDGSWTMGSLERSCGVDRGPFPFPLMVAPDGHVFDHEIGDHFDGRRPFLEGGPVGIGPGIYDVQQIQPDEKTLGDLVMTIRAKDTVMGAETVFGPFAPAEWTDIRVAGRFFSARFEAVGGDFRVGAPLIFAQFAGER